MTRDDAILFDVLLAAERACEFAAEVPGRREFGENELVKSAVLHQLMVMGEATKRLSNSYRDEHPDIPWRHMARMRDRLIHHYDGVDFDITWETVMVDLPEVIAQIRPLLPEL